MINEKNIESVLAQNGYIVAPVKGDSMLPMLDENQDAVRIVPVSYKLEKYDIPLYRRPNGKLVLHRIIEVKSNHYIICGDNRTNLEKVPFKWVIGVAEGFYKNGEYVSCKDEKYLEYVYEQCKDIEGRKIINGYVPEKGAVPPEWGFLIALLRASINEKEVKLPFPDNVDVNKLFLLAKRHMVAAAVYRKVAEVFPDSPTLDKWKNLSDMNLRKAILFDVERGAIVSEMEKAGIRYMFLKGIVINEMYPFKGMREFADNDILYDRSKQMELNRIMTDREYDTASLKGVHDTYYREPMYNFEMHKMLFSPRHPVAHEFTDPWKNAVKKGEFSYAQTDEDFYVYFIAHFYKHYSEGGAGLRSFADLWLIKKNTLDKNGIDRKYISERISRAGISEFEKEVLDVVERMFGDTPSEISPETLDFIMKSGAYGTMLNRIEKHVKNEGKLKYVLTRAFPPYQTMIEIYPSVYGKPYLLPFAWMLRLGRVVFVKKTRTNMKNEVRILKKLKNNTNGE